MFYRLGLFSAALLAGVAVAQTAPRTAPPAALPSLEKASDVPDAQKVKRADEATARMRQIYRDVLAQLSDARKSKDVVKLNCLNEKVTQIKGLLRISEQASTALLEAVDKKESAAAEHEYTKVMIARQKCEQLRAEAEECIGQLAFRTDENLQVEVEEPENLPTDPTKPQPQPDGFVDPVPASPTL